MGGPTHKAVWTPAGSVQKSRFMHHELPSRNSIGYRMQKSGAYKVRSPAQHSRPRAAACYVGLTSTPVRRGSSVVRNRASPRSATSAPRHFVRFAPARASLTFAPAFPPMTGAWPPSLAAFRPRLPPRLFSAAPVRRTRAAPLFRPPAAEPLRPLSCDRCA
jgi:hypothetical protein